jgi:predicted Rossmann fold flavoprotein
MKHTDYDVIVLGAGAAGLMCAYTAGERERRVLVIDHATKAGKKILLSGGGRCNFTNRYASKDTYLSQNPHFCISALSRYTQADFEAWVATAGIAYHEKTLGQLFCDESAKEILELLLNACTRNGVEIRLETRVEQIEKTAQNAQEDRFILHTQKGILTCTSLVIATGGLSFPTMGASPFGYKVAEQFGLCVLPVRAGLVPLTLHPQDLALFAELSGVSTEVRVSCGDTSFREALLFTHRGLSGPAILQISSYWQPGQAIQIDFFPDLNLLEYLQAKQQNGVRAELKTLLTEFLPSRLVHLLCEHYIHNKPLHQYNAPELTTLAHQLSTFSLKPNGTEGYRTAEVTLGGVDTEEISSKTFESKKVSRLYFIGEVLDVTGHLGGFNFQWAWSSGFCAGQYV